MQPNRETVLCRYHYDPLDRLVDCSPSAQSSTRRFYLKDRLATEVQGTVQRSIMQHEDQLLAQQQRQSGNVETRLLATDLQRSVLNVLDTTQPHSLSYTPYGHRPAENGLLSLLGFNGERPDPVTGWYFLGNGYRAFNPVLMRFNSPDSWSPFGKGGLNAYAYCVGDPVNRSDPTGHVSWLSLMQKFFPKAVSAANVGHFQLSGIPDVPFRRIVKLLKGDDLVALALSSKQMHGRVLQNTTPLNQVNELADADFLNAIREISLGNKSGHLPAQVIGNKELFKTAKHNVPNNDTSPGRDFLQNRYYVAIKNKKQKRLEWEAKRIREEQKAHHRKVYGEDWHSDTSYDSD
ncbi:RHS repeat-associated core domain-containing protein [Pseudomonas sp. B28(2017)]|uniref:RHS repeat-associated core domain-containing protein n=1 Tax=Pseudomonas sp. B28(2017) TaxID=1981730 RepID=UPI0021156E6D|nr:RHS repeat-associated core domain-containing protein [Pseudomonas sp. B28(2017)]